MSIKQSRRASTAANKIESRLHLALLKARNDSRTAALPDFRFVKPEADGRIPVDIIFASESGMKDVIALVTERNGVIRNINYPARRIDARVSLGDLESLASVESVRRIRQSIPAYTNAINVSEGDATHAAQTARALYGTDGTGQKVCVLSDGVDSLANLQASGDLPAVDVLPGQAGSGDEGSAMLEIVHDLAPGAELGFATAFTSEASFAQNILDLAADGCTIIVDDIIYLDESPFQDGPVAQSVNTVTAAGVLYFSSAGNEGNVNDLTSGTWEGDFAANGTPAVLAGAGPVHNFGDGGQSLLVESGDAQTPPLLIWAEHYDLNTGMASTDFDLYVLNGTLTTVFDASTDVQDGSGGDDFPIEFIGGGTFSGERLVVAQFAAGATSSVPMFNLIVFRGEVDDDLATSGTTRGHSAAVEAFSTAATPAAAAFSGVPADLGPYPNAFTSANVSEIFSADGPRRVILSSSGMELTPGNRTSTGGIVRQKPDITAADGVSTAAPGFSTFYGTSAAAPHAAAIAALIKTAVPGITPAQVRSALVTSALDIEAPGVDRDTGAGIIMADAALNTAGAEPQAYLVAGAWTLTQVLGDGDGFVENNEIFDVTIPLTNNGGVNATDISSVLSTAIPGVTVLNASSAYPDLAIGASGDNTTQFRFVVGDAAVCGSSIDFTLTATYTGSSLSPQAFTLPLKLGAPGTSATFSYTTPVVAIPDGIDLSGTAPGTPAVATLPVTGMSANVYDVDLRIDGAACDTTVGSSTVGLDHSFVNDLEVTLRSPDGNTVLVIDNTDGSGNNFCQTVLDDESAGANIQSVVSSNAPFSASFVPNAALSALDGAAADGNWELQAQDFFNQDTGNIRAFTLTVTPAVCDAPAAPLISATKTVSAGPYQATGSVVYTITLTNTGVGAQPDNVGDEFSDVLPAGLTVGTPSASSGTTSAAGINPVTWNGSIPAGASVTITIPATINADAGGQTIVNQGTAFVDADIDGSNETSVLTDAPGGAADEPTSFTVAASTANIVATKSVSAGPYTASGGVTYTITLTNNGLGAQLDNAGAEFTDLLPAALTVGSPSASSGAVSAAGVNPVTWNGGIPAGGSVTITIPATIDAFAGGQLISNQGSVSFDSDADNSNDASALTDAPGGGADEPTTFTVAASAAVVSGTKAVAGSFMVGGTVTYTITLTNTGANSQPDNPGDEFTDLLPAGLTVLTPSASSGTISGAGTNPVTWNGTIPSGGSVTLTIPARISAGTAGMTISNQGTIQFDGNVDGSNESTTLTDGPAAGLGDPTVFTVLTQEVPVPTLSREWLAVLVVLVATMGLMARRRA